MHSQQGVDAYLQAIEEVKQSGGTIECGGKVGKKDILFKMAKPIDT